MLRVLLVTGQAPRGTAWRLTAEDCERIRARMAGVVADWNAGRGGGRAPSSAVNLETLQRVGSHAIGCSTYDLRDVELEWIAAQAAELLEVS